MTERELQEQVRAMCRDLGLYCRHDFDSRRGAPGWPDCVILNMRTGRLMFRELKTETGVLTSQQKAVGYALRAGGHDWDVRRPSDLISGRVGAELAALAGHRLAAAPMGGRA